MERIKLDIVPKGITPICHVSQFDTGRVIRLDLMDGLQGYVLTDETVEIRVKKPDNNIVTAAVTATSGNAYVDVVTTEQMTACAGDNNCELRLTSGDVVIASLNFTMRVEVDPLKDGIESETVIHSLEAEVADIVANQYDSENVIFDETPTENHGIGYAVTSEGVLNAIPDELDDLSDVTYTGTPAMGEAVVWDGSKWTNGTPDMDVSDLADVTITTPSDDDILVYQNGEWVNMANPASTANFGADYDENTTYNTGDKCVYNNLLYECNDDGVTGAWDATKWDSLTVASMTDNNLPHYTGTPTQGSTAEAIEGKANKTEAVTFTPSTGITLNYSSIGKTDKQVGGSIICKYSSFVVGTWKELGYISAPPTDDIKTCSANNTTGQFAGMVRFEPNGKVSVYPQQAGEYAVAFSFAYRTT